VEPHTPAERVRWLDHAVEGLAHEIVSIRPQLRAVVLSSLALDQADQTLSDLLHQQLALMVRQCGLMRGQLAHLHTELTGSPLSETSTAGSTAAHEHQRAAHEPDEP
jgi:hypothetical protein